MKRIMVFASAAVIAVALLAGCDAKEREALQNKVTTLEQQLAEANNSLNETKTTLAAREEALSQVQVQLDSTEKARAEAAAKVTKLTNELNALKKAAAKKKKAAATTQKKPATK